MTHWSFLHALVAPWVVRAIEERNVYGLDTIWQIVIINSPETDSEMRHANRQAASSLEKVPPRFTAPDQTIRGFFVFGPPMNTCSLAAMFGQAWLWPLVLQALALETLSGTMNGLARSRITSRSPCSRGPPQHSAAPMRRFAARFPTGPPPGLSPARAHLKTLTARSVCSRCNHRASPNVSQHLPACLTCRNDLGIHPL